MREIQIGSWSRASLFTMLSTFQARRSREMEASLPVAGGTPRAAAAAREREEDRQR